MPNFVTTAHAGDQVEESPSPAPMTQSVSREQPPGQIVDAPKVSQPDLGQVEEKTDTNHLRQQVKHLENKFEDLLDAACDDLEERKTPIHKITRSLLVRRVSETNLDLVAGHRHEIQEANTLDKSGSLYTYFSPQFISV